VALAREAGLRRIEVIALAQLGTAALRRGQSDQAAAVFDEVIPLVRELGDPQHLATVLESRGMIARLQGDRAKAQALQQESLVLRRSLGNQAGIAYCLISLADGEDDPDLMAMMLEEALAIGRQLKERQIEGAALFNLGVVARLRGDASAATRFGEALEVARDSSLRVVAVDCIAELAGVLVAKWPKRAARLIGAAAAQRAALGVTPTQDEADHMAGLALRLQKDLGPGEFVAAEAEGRSLTLEAATVEALAGVAVESLMTAATGRMATGPEPTSADALGQGFGLTERELDVLRLLAEGRTDREIAETLFISAKTVGHHVTRILGKLGVESRTGAVALAIRRGLV
jgi:DNA-binding NarL/FixJ family response regulator